MCRNIEHRPATTVTETLSLDAPPPTGGGLTGVYYHGMGLATPVLTRTDTTVDFSWAGDPPDPTIPGDDYSARWSGQVEAPVSGVYTFFVTSDDGVRLWIDGEQLVDAWVDQGPTEYSGVITLTAGLRYDLALEYYENISDATIILEWQPPGGGRAVIPQAYLYAELPATYPTTRAITYAYDGLLRLTGANESPGTTYAYSYDNAGNRTGVWVNGTRTVTQTFNAANQVDGFTYDATGNLTDDGTATYGYDALNRMIIRNTTPYTYNGDGVLVFDGATRYTQDMAAPLTQILQTTQISTTNYLYGLERLAAQFGSTKLWYVGDALGSVRMMLDDGGAPLERIYYDPWGNPESGTVPTFGFTGEVQDSATGLVNLRARWYSTGNGTFTSVDPFAGFPEQPYSQHEYQYAYSDPIFYTDPTGLCGRPGESPCAPTPGPRPTPPPSTTPTSISAPAHGSKGTGTSVSGMILGSVAHTGETIRLGPLPSTGDTQPLSRLPKSPRGIGGMARGTAVTALIAMGVVCYAYVLNILDAAAANAHPPVLPGLRPTPSQLGASPTQPQMPMAGDGKPRYVVHYTNEPAYLKIKQSGKMKASGSENGYPANLFFTDTGPCPHPASPAPYDPWFLTMICIGIPNRYPIEMAGKAAEYYVVVDSTLMPYCNWYTMNHAIKTEQDCGLPNGTWGQEIEVPIVKMGKTEDLNTGKDIIYPIPIP
jgi:RHS repeat-associated protein